MNAEPSILMPPHLRSFARVMPLLLLLLFVLTVAGAHAEEVRVAVASNFVTTLKKIGDAFTKETGHTLAVSAGSTGKLFAQLQTGAAPFDLFLSADADRPKKLEEAELTEPGTRFTYAVGRLVLWSARPDQFVDMKAEEALMSEEVRHVAIANPQAAPFGAAAVEVLKGMGVWDGIQPKLVTGENIAQTMQFVESGAAELGFIANAQWKSLPRTRLGTAWGIPAEKHKPILQDAVALKGARPVARVFLDFLRSPAMLDLIDTDGYDRPTAPAHPAKKTETAK